MSSLNCRDCGRSLTFHRGAKEPPVLVGRKVTRVEDDQPGYVDLYYCGICFSNGKHEHRDGDYYMIGLGDSSATQRWVEMTPS